MTARILVADDEQMNLKLLEAKLGREYFTVMTAGDGESALLRAQEERPDLILLDAMMPRMDGFETCRRLKADPELAHIPIVILTALTARADRVRGLEAGADDFLSKPVDYTALLARVRSLVRAKFVADELRLRLETRDALGLAREPELDSASLRGRLLVVEDRDIEAARIRDALSGEHDVHRVSHAGEDDIVGLVDDRDLVAISLALREVDGLRLCARLRGADATRRVPVLILVPDTPEQHRRRDTGLELGVNDYVMRPADPAELRARVRTQLRRRRAEQWLRRQYRQGMELAMTDSLTGLHNRAYFEAHLDRVLRRSDVDKPVAMLLLDVDHFKAVNDRHGHVVGDEVLRELAQRIEGVLRSVDLAARYGGEEFVIVLPDTDGETAITVGERLRGEVADVPFTVSGEAGRVPVTVSIGIATSMADDGAVSLLRRADVALYRAKNAGRDRVELQSKA